MSNGVRWCQWHRMSDDTRKAYMRDKRLRENYKVGCFMAPKIVCRLDRDVPSAARPRLLLLRK